MKISNPIGIRGENMAAEYLLKKGYKIIERNFRKKYAEIDIIAVYKDILVFIEVKTRTSERFGTPIESISPWKLNLLMKAALLYKKYHVNLPEALRIDAISVSLLKSGELKSIEHIENING